jgi:16S rRNA (guanine966-N2)-methyltransferase
MRIVGGRHKGRRLEAPSGRNVRPTSDRTRETLFNIIGGGRYGGMDRVVGARVLDGFAGTGALGLEALSRGAASAVFMENTRRAIGSLRRNIEALDEDENARILACDVLRAPPAQEPVDIVLLDPPYGRAKGAQAIEALEAAGWLADDVLIVLEAGAKDGVDAPKGFEILEERVSGAARLVFIGRARSPAAGEGG